MVVRGLHHDANDAATKTKTSTLPLLMMMMMMIVICSFQFRTAALFSIFQPGLIPVKPLLTRFDREGPYGRPSVPAPGMERTVFVLGGPGCAVLLN